ncbi:MAG TPA: M24 family metallopeptidase [bacterium]|jgi:Xaa-Pro aminopeptidase|nr:M24 family metallopeptidase [bacterium]
MNKELSTKLQRLRGLLKARSLDGILLSSRANFSWLTGGRTNHIRSDVENGVASLWVTSKAIELWCNSIEEKRFQEEEAKGLPFTYRVHPWYETSRFPFKKAATDDRAFGLPSLKTDVAKLRWALLPEEIQRYRKVGKLSGEALEAVAKRVRNGWRENHVAAELSKELVGRGLEATVILVGSDERLKRYRHPLPTNHKIQKTVMMVICAKGYGLIANLTRIVHFGPIPVDLRRRHEACLQVECAMWAKSRIGVEAKEVFEAGVLEYAAQGFSGEWKKHHQGGPTGYETRDYLGTPDCANRLVENQALAWNPSITGTKSEDTVLLTKKGLELLTPTPHWPMVKVKCGGRDYQRPDILIVKS